MDSFSFISSSSINEIIIYLLTKVSIYGIIII